MGFDSAISAAAQDLTEREADGASEQGQENLPNEGDPLVSLSRTTTTAITHQPVGGRLDLRSRGLD